MRSWPIMSVTELALPDHKKNVKKKKKNVTHHPATTAMIAENSATPTMTPMACLTLKPRERRAAPAVQPVGLTAAIIQ